jgi:hypothetical protein
MAADIHVRLRLDDCVNTREHTDLACCRGVHRHVMEKLALFDLYDTPIKMANSIMEDCAMDLEAAEERYGA